MKHIYLFIAFVCILSSVSAKPVWIEKKPDLDSNSEHIYRIQCVDSNNCLALSPHGGYYGRLYYSSDKGRNWVRVWNDFTGNFNDIRNCSFNMSNPIKDHIFLTFSNSTLLKTKNNGTSWDTVQFEPKNMNLENIYMADSLNGIICGQPWPSGQPYLIFTNDGWNSYKAIPRDSLPLDLFLNYAYMEGKDTLMFITCGSGRTFVNWSFDKGISWVSDTLPGISAGNTYGKNFIKAPSGEYWLAGYLANGVGDQSIDVIYKLDKIGGTWIKVYSKELEYVFGLQEIAFGDSLNGVAVGQFGKILRTTDGGKTWFQEFIYTDGEIDGKAPVLLVEYCGSTPLIGDYNGRIFRLEDDGTGDVEEGNNYSNAYGIRTEVNDQEIKVNIKTEKSGEAKVAIFDMQGREIIAKNASLNVGISQLSISTSGLSSGIYMYAIEIDGIRIKTDKISIVR